MSREFSHWSRITAYHCHLLTLTSPPPIFWFANILNYIPIRNGAYIILCLHKSVTSTITLQYTPGDGWNCWLLPARKSILWKYIFITPLLVIINIKYVWYKTALYFANRVPQAECDGEWIGLLISIIMPTFLLWTSKKGHTMNHGPDFKRNLY